MYVLYRANTEEVPLRMPLYKRQNCIKVYIGHDFRAAVKLTEVWIKEKLSCDKITRYRVAKNSMLWLLVNTGAENLVIFALQEN